MAGQEMSAADRIRELSAINAEVATLLQLAGQAINSLTNRPLEKSTEDDDDEDTKMTEDDALTSIDDRKAAFSQHTEAYYTTLQSLTARLRRQAYALEEAGIISSEAPGLSSSSQQQRQNAPAAGPGRTQAGEGTSSDSERITNGGMGNLDVGWLNSRGNKVGVEKEGELIGEARKMLEEVLGENGDAG